MSIYQLLNDYDAAVLALQVHKMQNFPEGARVVVSCNQYSGEGVVHHELACPLNKLSVKLGNGNVWYYDLDKCKPI